MSGKNAAPEFTLATFFKDNICLGAIQILEKQNLCGKLPLCDVTKGDDTLCFFNWVSDNTPSQVSLCGC